VSLMQAIRQLKTAAISATALLDSCLAAARDQTGEGRRVFTELFADTAKEAADVANERLRSGGERGLEGVPISVKDLFDVCGSITQAGSRAMPEAAQASADADAVARLRAAGAVIVGKTNMTEFAYSGVGLNPHFGTPLNPYDRETRRIPGGSSSGAAVSVSDHMAFAALGTDTGGSIRIPAALCGLVGWKPTASRVSLIGVLPLSPTLDSVGPIAQDVAGCELIDSILTGRPIRSGANSQPLAGVRLGLPAQLFSEDTDGAVAGAIERALSSLSRAGARIVELPLPEIANVPAGGAAPVIVASEAYAWHRGNLAKHGECYDQRVRSRLERGAAYSAWEYLDALNCRASSIAAAKNGLQGLDGWLMPTVPVTAPPLASCERDEDFTRINKLLLRNPSIVNFLNGCAISLPCHRPGEAPVGLTLAGLANADAQILGLASAMEQILNGEL
jgi:aspartyl-tRNA(Asn)/glutamyl-tRNA(Gln) amidotransferase subunit A